MYGQMVMDQISLAQDVHVNAAVAVNVTWLDPIINFFYEWKIAASIISVMVLCSTGAGLIVYRKIVAGIITFILGIVLGVCFYNIEDLFTVAKNSKDKDFKPAKTKDPWKRGAAAGIQERDGVAFIVLERAGSPVTAA
ncbi:hypothetical protein PP613_23600 [Mycobacteroides abscessus]|nr:hypothetical protein [Mycobacteroides abscessus]MDM2412329.1 hypothetical protein [Mycobacteroides abscessus]